MIQLQASQELKQTFETLIKTINVPVKWNGIFAAIDNYLILQGEVRSLFFHFDTRQVTTNIIEIPAQEAADIGENTRVQNAINMILYAFGKWGTIKGLRVDKSFAQLQKLFSGILGEFEVEPEYTPEHMRFYRSGMRITYEDVIQTAFEYREEESEEYAGEVGGLWHKIIWKKASANFLQVETTLRERRMGRLGNNFYMIGYLCPTCGEKLHMVIYPMGKEFRIETEEGGVICARACTCSECQSFFTPRPKKLLAEGDIYTIEFGEDTKAYEDYLELLGRDGDRVSNYHCNEFADREDMEEEDEETLEELARNLPELSDLELRKLAARIEEGFYPDESIEGLEEYVHEQSRMRQGKQGIDAADGYENGREGKLEKHEAGVEDSEDEPGELKRGRSDAAREQGGHRVPDQARRNDRVSKQTHRNDRAPKQAHRNDQVPEQGRGDGAAPERAGGTDPADSSGHTNAASAKEHDEATRKYAARMEKLERYSGRQLKELKNQLEREQMLPRDVRHTYLEQVKQKLIAEQAASLEKKVDACEGKTYAVIKRVYDEVEDSELPMEEKEPLLARLSAWLRSRAQQEVEMLVQKMPKNLNRTQYRQYEERIRGYQDVDLSPYEEILHERRKAAEQQEIADLVKRARKVSREDVRELLTKLKEGDFLPDLVQPYIEKVEERLRKMDEKAIEALLPDLTHSSYEEGIEAYEQIAQGDFLPELKANALEMLSKRLSKIKTDECELLVKKLQDELAEAGLSENPKHHFYPARRVLLKQAAPEETELIEFALATYASNRGPFEYPILVVDSTKNGTGKEGLILTPENIYYSTMFSAYVIPVPSIKRVDASTGILNKGLHLYQENGTKMKLPYAVETKELPVFAQVIDSFVHYLREKPDSRKLTYLAKEKHEKICCFRCGFEYQGGGVCPKCGYQNNE